LATGQYAVFMDINPRIAALGAEIRERRKELGLTQARLAAMTDLSRASINALEAGSTDLGLAKVLKVAEVLGVHLHFKKAAAGKLKWLETAAVSASVSYRKALPSAVIARAAKTGEVPAEYLAHMATLLDEASPALLVRALREVFPQGVPKEAWDNLARIGKATRSSRRFLQ
jgi:transcriptional regulator with XRE-family HTH domain